MEVVVIMNKIRKGVYTLVALLVSGGTATVQADFFSRAAEEMSRRQDAKEMRSTSVPHYDEEGEETLQAFGTKYLPEIYDLYRKKREEAKKWEEILRGEFPNGRESDPQGGQLYDKFVLKMKKAVDEMNRGRNALCHYYLLYKADIMTDTELKEIDSREVFIEFFQMKNPRDIDDPKEPTESDVMFAKKYLPAVRARYDCLQDIFMDGKEQYRALESDRVKIGAACGGMVLEPLAERLIEIRQWLDKLVGVMKEQRLLYRLKETTEEQLEELDRRMDVEIPLPGRWFPIRDYWHFHQDRLREREQGGKQIEGERKAPSEMSHVPDEMLKKPDEMLKKEEDNAKPDVVVKEEVVVEEPIPVIPPEPPKRPEAEILREEETYRKNVWVQIEAARKESKAEPMESFAGIHFGKPLAPGATMEQIAPKIVKWGTALDETAGDSIAARGVAFAVYGPKFAKPFMSFGSVPLVWVTPKERRPYRIEFSRPLAPKADKHDPETTNLVASLQRKFKEPFVTRPLVPGRAGCEFVFPQGVITIVVGEYGNMLTFAIERSDIKEQALPETEALRREKGDVSADGVVLDSNRYPNGGFNRTKYLGLQPFREGTPAAFCGVEFGSQPPEIATVVVPQKGPKGFFLDYAMMRCSPFRGFAYGRADIDPVRGGVYAVHLMSEGGTEGRDDRDYYESVKASLTAHYKVKPIEKPGEGGFPNLNYQVGDLTVVFGPDPRGGFRLFARNEVLTALAHTEPAVASAR